MTTTKNWSRLRAVCFFKISNSLVYAPSSFLKLPSFSSCVSREVSAHSLSNLSRVSHNSVAVYLKSYCRLSETQISSKSVNSIRASINLSHKINSKREAFERAHLKTCNCRRGKLTLKNVSCFCQALLCVIWCLNRTAVPLS